MWNKNLLTTCFPLRRGAPLGLGLCRLVVTAGVGVATLTACNSSPPTTAGAPSSNSGSASNASGAGNTTTGAAPLPAALRFVPLVASQQSQAGLAARVLLGATSSAAVSAPATLRVVKVHVQPGDQVAANAPLADVVLPDMASASAVAASSDAELTALRAKRDQLQKLKDAGLGKTSELATADAELAAKSGQRAAALAQLRSAGLAVGDANRLAHSGGRTTLRSPIAGTVVQVQAMQGAAFTSDSPPLFMIAASNARRIEARVTTLPAARNFVFTSGGQAVPVQMINQGPAPEGDGATLIWFEPTDPATTLVAGARGVIEQTGASAAWDVPNNALLLGVDAINTSAVHVLRRRAGATTKVEVLVIASRASGSVIAARNPGDLVAGDELADNPEIVTTQAGAGEAP